MRMIVTVFASLLCAASLASAQTLEGSYSLFTSGVNDRYGGSLDLAATAPMGIFAAGMFDHDEGDKDYVEGTVGVHLDHMVHAVYEVQDTAHHEADHLLGVGYARGVGPFTLGGKFFPYSTNDATDFAAELNASTTWADWGFAGFVDVTRDSILDDARWFSKARATRPMMPHMHFVGEYRWTRDMFRNDRSVWFGVSMSM